MSNKKKVDLRIQRSRASMQEALATLMTEKTYEKIKVSEITDQAYVARPTFYLHFKTKDELLLSVIDEFFEQFLADFDAYLMGFPENFEGLLKFVLQEWVKHASIIQMIIKAGRGNLLLERFQQYTELAVERIAASERFTVDLETLQYAGDIHQAYGTIHPRHPCPPDNQFASQHFACECPHRYYDHQANWQQ